MTALAAKIRTALAGRSQHLLDAAGLGLIALALGMLAVPAGVAAAGVSVLLVNWRLHGDE